MRPGSSRDVVLTFLFVRRRKIASGEGDQLGDLSTLAEPAVIDQIKEKFAKA